MAEQEPRASEVENTSEHDRDGDTKQQHGEAEALWQSIDAESQLAIMRRMQREGPGNISFSASSTGTANLSVTILIEGRCLIHDCASQEESVSTYSEATVLMAREEWTKKMFKKKIMKDVFRVFNFCFHEEDSMYGSRLCQKVFAVIGKKMSVSEWEGKDAYKSVTTHILARRRGEVSTQVGLQVVGECL